MIQDSNLELQEKEFFIYCNFSPFFCTNIKDLLPTSFLLIFEAMQSFLKKLFQPTDISSLVFFRIAFGFIMLVEVCRYLYFDWVEKYWIDPIFYFTYEGFHWIAPWGKNGMYIHFLFVGILAVFILLGLFYRISSILMFFAFTYIFLLDKSNYLNHFYLISLLSFIMIFLPAHRSFSLDAKINPSIQSDLVPWWTVFILQFQIGVAYFFGGIAKLNWDWLKGEPMRKWLSPKTDFPILGAYFNEPWAAWFFSYSGLFLDLLIVPFLLWKKTRIPAFIAIIIFHLMNAELFSIGIFPWFMIAATTIYFETNWFRKVLDRLKVNNSFIKLKENGLGYANPAVFKNSKIIVIGFGLYCLIQVLLPFRHHTFKGNVNWTEEGHRFAWHMKLRDKRAKALFLVRDLDTFKEYKEDPDKYLSRRQERKMRTRPDMILQYAHYLERIYKAKGHKNVEVRAKITASLNSRDYQNLIDPEVDLTKEKYSIWHDEWIVPLTKPFKPTPLKKRNVKNTDNKGTK